MFLGGVTPRAGVWIEITTGWDTGTVALVTPRAGVWIEIEKGVQDLGLGDVTPRAGVWIEMVNWFCTIVTLTSHPVRVCGLKFLSISLNYHKYKVTPRAGVWIEISNSVIFIPP